MTGGYKFDADELDAIIRQLNNLIDDYLAPARITGGALAGVLPPGDEDVSKQFADQARVSGEAYLRFIDATVVGLQDYVEKLQQARERILTQEDSTTQALTHKEQDS